MGAVKNLAASTFAGVALAAGGCGETTQADEQPFTPIPSPPQVYESAAPGRQAPAPTFSPTVAAECADQAEVEITRRNDFYLARNIGGVCVNVLHSDGVQNAGSIGPGLEFRVECLDEDNELRILWEGGTAILPISNMVDIPRCS